MKKLLMIALLIPAIALAEITPTQGRYDPRVRVIDYNPMNVVKLSTFYGVSTHVQFEQGETINAIAVGDDLAWKVTDKQNHLFIKPLATNADTNVTVVTDRRTYNFALIVQPRPMKDSKAWANPNLIFSLMFRYPDVEELKRQAAAQKEAEKTAKREVKAKLKNAAKRTDNYDYWVAGSEEVSPTAARDDGRFIYLTFSNNRDMPAVYLADNDNKESLINTNVVDGNTIVVQRLVQRLVLRKGAYVASILNKSFDMDGGRDNTTGTVAPDVERVIKEIE